MFSMPCVQFRTLLDKSSTNQIHTCLCPISAVVGLDENENVREFLGTKRLGKVHHDILRTLEEAPELFPLLNGGMVVVASEVSYDTQTKTASLLNPSIVNGSQTKGTIAIFLDGLEDRESAPDASVFMQIIVTQDPELIRQLSIARNVQTPVKSLSILGRLGFLEDLETAFKIHHPGLKLRQSESDAFSQDYVDALDLIQVTTALLPEEILGQFELISRSKAAKAEEGEDDDEEEEGDNVKRFSRNRPYSSKGSCETFYRNACKDREKSKKCAGIVQAYLDLCGPAWSIFRGWESNQAFRSYYVTKRSKSSKSKKPQDQPIVKDKSGAVVRVKSGLIFPIVAAHHKYVKKDTTGTWVIDTPATLSDSAQAIADQIWDLYKMNGRSASRLGKTKEAYRSMGRVLP
jgi:hypothetical protein